MNLVLLREDDFLGPDLVRLEGRRHVHIRKVLRARKGDLIRVGRLDGPLGTGRVERFGDDGVELRVTLDEPPPSPSQVTLLLALPRPKVLSRVLATVVVLGIKDLYLFDCWRVEKSFWDSARLAPSRIEADLAEGLEQARDTLLPRVHLVRRFRPFVEDELPGIVGDRRAVVAHPVGPSRPGQRDGESLVLAIGPEGGFIPNEVTMFEAAGFEAWSWGPRILHVEAAVPALVAALTDESPR